MVAGVRWAQGHGRLLATTSGIEHEVVAGAEVRQIRPGFSLRVAALGHLVALKVLSESDSRLQDRIDLRNLLAAASEEEVARARAGIDLMNQRDRARGKDLHAILDRYIALAAQA